MCLMSLPPFPGWQRHSHFAKVAVSMKLGSTEQGSGHHEHPVCGLLVTCDKYQKLLGTGALPASSGISPSWMEKTLQRLHWSAGLASMSSSAWYFFLLLSSFLSLPDSFHLTVESKEGNEHPEELTFKLPHVTTHRLRGFGEVLEALWRQRWCCVLLPFPEHCLRVGSWPFASYMQGEIEGFPDSPPATTQETGRRGYSYHELLVPSELGSQIHTEGDSIDARGGISNRGEEWTSQLIILNIHLEANEIIRHLMSHAK